MAKFSTLFTDVLSQAQDCPKVVAVNEIRKAAIELCEKSAIWTRNHDAIYTYKNGAEYDLDDTPTDAEVDRLLDAKLDGRPFAIGGPRDLFDIGTDEIGTPKVCAIVRPQVISLSPVPAGRHALLIRVAYKPSNAATEMDDDIMQKWRDTLVQGALYRLKMMANKPWSDTQTAAVHKTLFDQGLRQAKLKAVTGYGSTSNTVRSRSFG